MTVELLDIYNDMNEPLGFNKDKELVHRGGDYHRTVHVWLLNEKDELLLQLRSHDKSSFPGYWDISAAGHVQSGETELQAAVRELHEELGITAEESDFEFITVVNYRSAKNNEFGYVYLLRCDYELSDFVFEDHEVEAVRYVHYLKLKKMIENKEKNLLVHNNEEELLFKYIEEKKNGIQKV